MLFDAIRSGEVRKVQAALAQGLDANATTALGQTPLMLAASLGSVQIVHLLLDRHASINAKDQNGATALLTASTSGHFAVIRELLKRGGNINSSNEAGMTPVLAAIMSDQFGVAEYLVRPGRRVGPWSMQLPRSLPQRLAVLSACLWLRSPTSSRTSSYINKQPQPGLTN